ncbi:glycosyltransferase [Rhizorhapis sp. SPR117]|uniref:glycosyltransferase n=1 Tax=Rhizorhapis sp. SPR117 TaxID=2912611 RepID=UPI001F367EDF|nr:glycosyltransferase [Rhizorhapis sp. SPR117]
MKVLYDITTLANIHCAPNTRPTGIFKHTEAMGLALAAIDDIKLRLSTIPSQHGKALRYLQETGRFGLERFVFSPQTDHEVGARLMSGVLDASLKNGALQSLVRTYHSQNYAPSHIYNHGEFDIYHVNWRGENILPSDSYPSVVLTVYDVIALKNPEWFVKENQPNAIGDYLTGLLNSVRSHHHVTVSTQCVKNDLLELFAHISPEQVHVTPLGVSPMFERCGDPLAMQSVRKRYGIPEGARYILCVNTLEPRKNMETVIDAYSLLQAEGKADDLCLVLAGSSGWLSEHIKAIADKLDNGDTSRILVTGYVEDEDLPVLYSGASVFCYPSYDEGFGLPVLEAMKCGTLVITSNCPALREVSADGALHVEPTDSLALAEAIHGVLTETAQAESLRQRGQARAQTFTWERSAQAMHEVYRQAQRPKYGATHTLSAENPLPVDTRVLCETKLLEQDVQRLQELKNKYRGNEIFIVSGSPDVQNIPSNHLKDKYTFAIDGFRRIYNYIYWKPNFYMTTDWHENPELAREINGLTGSTFFFEEKCREILRGGPDVYFYTTVHTNSGTSLANPASFDVSAGLFEEGHALPMAMQLVFHMGFDPVYLVGCGLEIQKYSQTHRKFKDRIMKAGKQVFEVTTGDSAEIYSPCDLRRVDI